jgi:hypothetical protein
MKQFLQIQNGVPELRWTGVLLGPGGLKKYTKHTVVFLSLDESKFSPSRGSRHSIDVTFTSRMQKLKSLTRYKDAQKCFLKVLNRRKFSLVLFLKSRKFSFCIFSVKFVCNQCFGTGSALGSNSMAALIRIIPNADPDPGGLKRAKM